jgi:DNA-binding NtrC family response regulator
MVVHPTATPIRVLIVDDDALIRWACAETLKDRGYRVTEAIDGRSALDAVARAIDPIDVILLDYRLPDANGLGVLARLRSLSPDSRIVLMTAHGTPETARGALRMGAARIVDKPIEMQDLAGVVSGACEGFPVTGD